jgi:hypothetical protein
LIVTVTAAVAPAGDAAQAAPDVPPDAAAEPPVDAGADAAVDGAPAGDAAPPLEAAGEAGLLEQAATRNAMTNAGTRASLRM